jgi:hypothetical protein
MEGKLWEFVLVHSSLPTLAKERAIISKYEITKAFFDVNLTLKIHFRQKKNSPFIQYMVLNDKSRLLG